MLSADLC